MDTVVKAPDERDPVNFGPTRGDRHRPGDPKQIRSSRSRPNPDYASRYARRPGTLRIRHAKHRGTTPSDYQPRREESVWPVRVWEKVTVARLPPGWLLHRRAPGW